MAAISCSVQERPSNKLACKQRLEDVECWRWGWGGGGGVGGANILRRVPAREV